MHGAFLLGKTPLYYSSAYAILTVMTSPHSHQRGFTIVELLIVIVVIAILAAITIVAYNGIVERAKISAITSDLSSAYRLLAADNITSDKYPNSAAAANGGQGLRPSQGITYDYVVDGDGYCLSATDGRLKYHVDSKSNVAVVGGCFENGGVVTTLAGSGNGNGAFADGTGSAAAFYLPSGIVVGPDGTLVVVDYINSRIRKVTQAGVVTTFAGTTFGFTDGTGTAASFRYPQGIAIDAAGTMYVADTTNNAIRKITQGGVVTTLAGSGSSGFANGTGAAATFVQPGGVAVDTAGNVYVADSGNSVIRKVTQAGVVTTFAGNGTAGYANGNGTAAAFSSPRGVAVDASGNVYVADDNNHRIRKITPSGDVTNLAGDGRSAYADGPAATAAFDKPYGVAVGPGGVVYVADYANNRIRAITSAGIVSTVAGSNEGYVDGTGTAALFNRPFGLTVGSNGIIYVVDSSNHRIRVIK